MAMTPSQLSIIVSSKGVADATVELDKLAKAAASVDAETKSFVIAQAKLQDSQKKTTESTKQTSQALIEQKRDYVTWQMAGQSAMKQANEALRTYNQTTKEYSNLWKQMDTQKLLEQTQQYKLYKISVEEASKALKDAEKIEKAHGDALEMNKKFDAQRIKSLQNSTEVIKMNARGVTEQEFAMIKAHEQALKMNAAFDKKAAALKNVTHHGNIFNNTLRSMATAALAYMGVNFFAGIIKDADSWSMMQAKLNLAVGSMEMAKVAQKDLYEMSQRARVPLEDSAKLFTRMSVPLQKMGQSVGEVQKVVESFSMALKLGGATGQEASSAMLQLSQSFNAGRLNGGEFNSVAEAAPSVLRAVEKELIRVGKGADLARYGLKELAAKGVVSTEVMAEALKRAAPMWKEEFEKLPLTVDGAITRIKNAWQKAIGEMGQDTKFNEDLAKTLSKLESELPRIANAIGKALLFIVDNGEAILKTFGAVVTLFAASKLIEASYTFMKLAESIGLVTAAGNLLGLTPIGKIILGVTAVVGAGALVWNSYSNKLDDVAKKQEEYSKAIPDIIAKLEGETRAIAKKNEVLDTELAIRNELERFNGKASAKEIQMSDLSEYKQILANVNLARMRMEDAKKAFATRKSNEIGSTLEAEVKATTEAFKKAEALMKNPDTFKKFKLAELDKETNTLFAANDARAKASAELINKYKSDNEKAKTLRDAALATLNTQYSKELELQNKNLITAEAYYAAKRGIEREYLESLDKQKKVKKEPSGMFLNQGKDDLFEDTDKRIIDFAKAQEKKVKSSAESLKAAEDELAKIKALVIGYHDKKQALIDLQIAEQEAKLKSIDKSIASKEEIDNINKTIKVLQDLKGAQADLTGLDSGKKAFEDYEKFMDSAKVDKFGKSFTDSMGKAGKAVTNVSKVLENMSKTYSTLNKQQENLRKAKETGFISEERYQQELANIESSRFGTAMNLYGDMAEAAKGFFEEGSKGYKTLDGISKVVHAAQLARNLVEMGQLAVKAVMNQAGGDPYSAWARMGAMAAAVAALGFAVGGGFNKSAGGMTAADVQKTQGGGTVFGDTEAKSESISKSIEMLKASYDKLYPVNQKMLSSLQSIEASMTGLANLIIKQGGIADGANFNVKEGTLSKGMGGVMGSVLPVLIPVIGSLISNLWGKTTQNIVDSGVQFGGSLTDVQKGKGFNQYASIDTTTSSWFGLKKDTRNTVQTQGMSEEINNQIAMVFTNMQKTLEEAGKALYGSSTGVTNALSNMVMEVSKISLKGLSGDDVTKAINNVISKALDQMAATAFTSLDKFESVIGEGYAQKVIRIANTFATVNATMEKFNFKLFEMNDAGIQASLTFSKMFGSLQEMQGVTSSYFENFYREEDQLKIKTDAVTKIMKSLGQEMPTTREGFKLLVDNAQKVGNTELVANLMKASGAFAEVVKWIEKTADASDKMDYNNTDPMFPDMSTLRDNAREVFNELSQTAQKWLSISKQASDVRASINTILWGNSATQDAAVKKSEKLWKMMASDITVEQKLSLAGELKDAILSKYQLERESVTKLIDFSKQLRTYVDGLKLGSLSPLTMTQKLAEARRQYETTLAKAQAGDTTAQGALTGSASAYLEIAKTAYASGDAYQAIFNNITSTLESMTLDTRTADDKLLEINKAQEAELIKLVLQLNTIESVADSYYKTTVQSMSNQLTALNNIYTKMGVFDGVAIELGGLPAEIAAALSGTFGRTSGEDYVKALYSKYANKTGNQIDQEGMQYWTREFELFGREYVLKAFQDSVAKMARESSMPSAPFAPAPMMAPTQASVLTEQVATLKEEITKLREDAQMQTIALMETLTLTSKRNADRIVEGTTEGMDKNNPNWNKVTIE